MAETAADQPRPKGILGWIERTGNALPDPVFIFLWLILILAVRFKVLSGCASVRWRWRRQRRASTGSA